MRPHHIQNPAERPDAHRIVPRNSDVVFSSTLSRQPHVETFLTGFGSQISPTPAQDRRTRDRAEASYGQNLVANEMETNQSWRPSLFEMTFDCFSYVRSKLVQRISLCNNVGPNPAGDKTTLKRLFNHK